MRPADLVTFTEEIFNGKLRFLYSAFPIFGVSFTTFSSFCSKVSLYLISTAIPEFMNMKYGKSEFS